MVLEMDNRNYLVWSYRMDLFETQRATQTDKNKWNEIILKEINWVEGMIQRDCRNNSAWNFRSNIIREVELPYEEDLKFVLNELNNRINNEAVWNYFNGMDFFHCISPESILIIFRI